MLLATPSWAAQLAEYTNLPQSIATAISAGVPLYLLDTQYGVRDLYWLLEVHCVDQHNKMIVQRENAKGK